MKLLFFIFLPFATVAYAGQFNVLQFGAVGDGKTLDTVAIQKTIDAATAAGGGTVLIPAGKFLTGPFTLASHIHLQLAASTVILINNDLAHYPIVKQRYQDAITADHAEDIEISGDGIIDGQGEKWWDAFRADPKMTHRPYLIKFSNCKQLKVTGVTLRHSPMFHLVPENCTDVTIQGITIQSPENAPNTDGIDPSGWNFLIADCHIDTGDDDIAIKPARNPARTPGNKNFLVKNCTFGHGHGMSVGGGTTGGLEDLTVTNCSFNQTDYGIRIKTVRGNGGLLQNCIYENLQLTAIKKSPISIVDYYPERNAPANPAMEKAEAINDRTPQNRNIIIRDVIATDCPNAGVIRGLPEAPITDLLFTNVQISATTGMTIFHATGIQFTASKITAKKGAAVTTFDAQVEGLATTDFGTTK